MTVVGLVLAAGASTRFGSNKLLASLPDGRPVWRASFDAYAQHPEVDSVGIVVSPELEDSARASGAAFVTLGGETRVQSCLRGLEECPAGSLVLVHDAARPFVSRELIGSVTDAARTTGAAIPVVPVTDTIKTLRDGVVSATLDRSSLFRAQTPQAASREDLMRALEAHPDATDDASALEAIGVEVKAVPGDALNVKITTMADFPQNAMLPSTGIGFDIHAFSKDPSRRLVLGGVEFEGVPGLEGHSDADVVLHALTDALLGTVGAGDIGQMFPNTDAEWMNADSLVFLRAAVGAVRAEGGEIVSADITVLAEIPKLGDKREKIRSIISQELGVPQRRVNIKATTMEGLGAIGRSEGIAAMATVSVLLQRP